MSKRSGQACIENIPYSDLYEATRQFQREIESIHITGVFPLEFWSYNFIRPTSTGYLSCRRIHDAIYSTFVPYSVITVC